MNARALARVKPEKMCPMRVAVRRTGKLTKRDLLLFDEIHVMGLDGALRSMFDANPQSSADLEYLVERNIVHDAPEHSNELADYVRGLLRFELAPLLAEFDEHDIEWPSGDGSRRDLLIQAELLASSGGHPAAQFMARPLPAGGELLVSFAERLAGFKSVPVLERELSQRDWVNLGSGLVIPRALRGIDPRGSRVADVVLRALPVPGDHCSLEEVVDFRSDPDVREKADELRLWMERMSRLELGIEELEAELEQLLHDFRRHMSIHHIKSDISALRLVMSVSLEVAEELAHLRPKKAFDALFDLRQRKAARLEAELTSRGHEVAFIDAAYSQFRP